MDTIQTNELTYTKVNDIDLKLNEVLDLVTDINPESSTTLKDLTSQVKTTTDSINTKVTKIKENTENLLADHTTLHTNISIVNSNLEDLSSSATTIMQTSENNSTKLDTIIQNLENQTDTDNTSVDFSSIEEKIDNVNANINTINSNISSMENDVTTTNSNVATNKNNITSIKTTVEKIEDKIPNEQHYNVIDSKLNEILKTVKSIKGEETFVDDPYKLNLPYNGRIEINRNPNNYDFYEITKEYETIFYFFPIMAHCTSETFSYKFEITFTCATDTRLRFNSNFKNQYKDFSSGTHTFSLSGENIKVVNDKILFSSYAFESIVVHHIKMELFGDNMIILPRKRKHKVKFALNKIIITKVENNNGYYLELDKNHALTPNMLNQEFILDVENVKDYDRSYDFTTYRKVKYSLAPIRTYVSLDSKLYHSYGIEGFNFDKSIATFSCDLGYYNGNNSILGTLAYHTELEPRSNFYTVSSTLSRSYLNLEAGNVAEEIMLIDTTRFDNTNKTAHVITNIQFCF